MPSESFHSTTVIAVRRGDKVAMAGDGQVTMGNSMSIAARRSDNLARAGGVRPICAAIVTLRRQPPADVEIAAARAAASILRGFFRSGRGCLRIAAWEMAGTIASVKRCGQVPELDQTYPRQ